MVTSRGRRSSLRILNAMQRNRTRIRSAIKETKGRLARWKLHVTVDKSIREIERSKDEEKDESVENIICQLLDQRMVSQRRDKSCAPSH